MLSNHDGGNLGAGGKNAVGMERYYHDTTIADRESLRMGSIPEGMSAGITYAFGPHAPADLKDGMRLTRQDVVDLLRGEWRGRSVQNAHVETRFMGWDMTFSDIKGLSLVLAMADPPTRAVLDEIRREAALKVLRDVAVPEMYSRAGHGGYEHIPVSVPVVIYEQHLSRASDPQTHLHCIVPSFGWGADGRAHTVEFHEVYKSKLAIGQAYRVEVARLVEERLGLRVYRDEQGELHVKGVSRELEALFSKRRGQRDAELQKRLGPDAWTEASAAQKMAATVASRPKHDREYREDWAQQAREGGLQADWDLAVKAVAAGLQANRDTQRLSSEERQRALDRAVDEARVTVTMGGVSTVTGKEAAGSAVVEQRQLLAETAARAIGTGASLDEVCQAVDRAMERRQVVVHAAGETPLSAKVTTPEMKALEQRLRSHWRELLDSPGHGVSPEHVQQAIREWETANPGKTLSPEQVAAVTAMTADRGAGLVEGLAGTGKTEALAVVRRAYELARYRVIGESYSGAAASELQKSAGIASRTTALAEVHGRRLDAKTVVVMDEAARATSPQLARLAADVKEVGAKVILVGDPRQLQPIGPGTAFPHLARDVHDRAPEASATIQEIRRQEKAVPEVREVAELAARGQAGEALLKADAHGMVSVHEATDDMRQAVARELADKIAEGKRAMGITATRDDARALNEAVHKELQQRGLVSKEERQYTASDSRSVTLAEGSRAAFTRNDYELGVRNGWRGEVVGIARQTGTVTVKLDDHVCTNRAGETMNTAVPEVRSDGSMRVHYRDAERYVSVPAEQVSRSLSLDYARTADRAQGITVDHAAVAAHADSNRFDRQWGAVAFTRQRETISVHVSTEGMERPEQRQATYEGPHWPRERQDERRQEQAGTNPLREAREERAQAKEAVQEAGQTWHEKGEELRQARQDLCDARAVGDGRAVAAARDAVREAREQERAAHADYRDAKQHHREARDTARDAWAEAKSAAGGQGKERSERAVPEPRWVSPEVQAEVVQAAAKQLHRDRPGQSTLDHTAGRDGQERRLERPVKRPERRHERPDRGYEQHQDYGLSR
ncbi:MAG TPA: MobF family relaxase [bacterium]|nr:MobF family relaxase [bacterium]